MIKKLLLMTLIAFIPAAGFASDWEISQLASQLEYASHDLSRNSKGMRGFSSVSHNAKRLSDKAEKLADSIARGRSTAYIRTRYSDVSRYYQRLEKAFLKANRSYGSRFTGSDFELVANLYDGLSYQFYGDHYYQGNRSASPYYSFGQSYRYDTPYYSNPRVFVFPQYNRGNRDQRRGPNNGGQRGRNPYDHASNVIVRQNRNDRSNNRMRSNRNDDIARNNGRDEQRNQRRNNNADSRRDDRDRPANENQNRQRPDADANETTRNGTRSPSQNGRAANLANSNRNGQIRNENRINSERSRQVQNRQERQAANRVTNGNRADRRSNESTSNAAEANRATLENRSNRAERGRSTEINRGNGYDSNVRRGRPD